MLFHGVPLYCINRSAARYFLPPSVIVSVLQIENGKVGQAIKNKNGTYDYGPMQVNSIWLKKLKPYGITAYDLQYNPCINVDVGTWILAQQIGNSRYLWKGVGNYHSHSFYKNTSYGYKVNRIYRLIENYLRKDKKYGKGMTMLR